jgi:hypothetical protein
MADGASLDGRAEGEDEREPTAEKIEAFRRAQIYATGEWASAEMFPRMFNMSAGFMYQAVLRAEEPDRPEYVTVTLPAGCWDDEQAMAMVNAVSQWNSLWEAAQFRRRCFDEDALPPQIARIADRGDVNVVFVPRSTSRYHEYASLYHLLPRPTLERFGLPLLSAGQWPFMSQIAAVDPYLPADFEHRLARAWGSAVWRHLIPASPISAFTRDEPIRLLAHNLDFWLPAVTEVIQGILRGLPVADCGIEEGPVRLTDGSVLPATVRANPRMGSDLWRGEADAAGVLAWTVEEADATGPARYPRRGALQPHRGRFSSPMVLCEGGFRAQAVSQAEQD